MPDQPDNDLEILMPDHSLTLQGKAITVREYLFMEGLSVQQQAAGLLADLAELFLDNHKDLDMDTLGAVFANHAEIMPHLIGLACDQPPEWVDGLGDADGQLLLMTWWAVNKGFFIRRLVATAAARQGQAMAKASESDGAPSLPS